MTTELATRQETGVTTMMERLATSPDVDVAKLEKLMEMQERILARDSEAAFNAAFADMQAEMPIITERGEIKHGDKVISTYGRFEDINETVKPVLQKHGFGVSFRVDISDGAINVTGILMHRDGHREQTMMALPADTSGSKNAVQAMGSSVSYGKRYVLCALLNISTRGEDDDGVNAVASEIISESELADLLAMCDEVNADKEAFCKVLNVESLDMLPKSKLKGAISRLERKRRQK